MLDKLVSKTLEIFYSKDKTKLYLILLLTSAFIIRIIAISNMGLSADDAIHSIRPINVIETRRLVEYGQSSVLWYYIQEVFYKIFGASLMGSRFASALFGSFFVILMYLFTKEVFKSKKAGLIASVLTAFSPFLVKMSMPEMDMTVMFFVVFSALMAYKHIEKFETKYLILSALLMGLAVLIKIYAIFFAFSIFVFLFLNYRKSSLDNKINLKRLFMFFIIIFLMFTPTITYNYLLYKDKGILDLMFTNYFKLGQEKAKELYGWGAGWMPKTDVVGFLLGNQANYAGETSSFYKLPGFLVLLFLIFKEEPIILLFGIAGLVLCFKFKKEFSWMFLLLTILPFIYLGSHIPMLKHFTFIPAFFIPSAAFFLILMSNYFHSRFKVKLRYILIIFVLFNLFWMARGVGGLNSSIYSSSGESEIMDFKEKNINPDSLVIVDSRIYRGFIGWMFSDRNYLESSLLNSAVEESNKYGNYRLIEVYFIECIKDDCGWGTIKNQPEFNQSMEAIVSWFEGNSKLIGELKGVDRKTYSLPLVHDKQESYRVYKTSFNLSYSIIPIARSTHTVLMYPIGYDSEIGGVFDDYEARGFFDKTLNNLSFYLLIICIILSLFSLLYLKYLFIMDE